MNLRRTQSGKTNVVQPPQVSIGVIMGVYRASIFLIIPGVWV